MVEEVSKFKSGENNVPVSSNPLLSLFKRQVDSARNNPFNFFRTISIWGIAIWIYYIVADEFVRQSLLNLTPGRIDSLDLPFYVLSESVDSGTTYVTAAIATIVVFGLYLLSAGNLTPR